MSATVDKLLALAANRFGVERQLLAGPDDVFGALGIDSVQVLELLSEVEEAFGVEIPDYELRDLRTFDELAACIDQRR